METFPVISLSVSHTDIVPFLQYLSASQFLMYLSSQCSSEVGQCCYPHFTDGEQRQKSTKARSALEIMLYWCSYTSKPSILPQIQLILAKKCFGWYNLYWFPEQTKVYQQKHFFFFFFCQYNGLFLVQKCCKQITPLNDITTQAKGVVQTCPK